MKLKELVITILLLGILTSGCVSMTIDSKVDNSGNLQNYKVVVSTNSCVYGLLNSEMSDDGMTIRESVEANGGTYTEEWNEEEDEVDIIIEKINNESVDIQVEGDYIIFRDDFTDMSELTSRYDDDDMTSEMVNSAIKIHYYLEMPGKIVDSNANTVDGNKAEWHMMDLKSTKPIYAKSEVSTLPGFRIAEGLFSLLFSLYIIKRV